MLRDVLLDIVKQQDKRIALLEDKLNATNSKIN